MTAALDGMSHWLDIGHSLLRILIVWTLAWILLRFLRKVLATFGSHISRANHSTGSRRIDTLTNVFRYASNIVIVGMALMLTLSEFGIAITPILATAGVAGIAIGFGAQSLVKDFFTGLFLLLENQVSEGDLIEAAGKSGYVERVTLRHIRIRDYDGSVHFIPNGMITLVTNRSRDFGFAVIDLDVPGGEDIEHVFELMRQVAGEMRKDPEIGPSIIDDIDIAGVEKLEGTGAVVRCRIKVIPTRQWRVRREFLLRIRSALETERQKQHPT